MELTPLSRPAFPVAALLALLLAAPAAPADIPSLKAACEPRDALDDDAVNGVQLPYRFCDDGVPPAGGRTPNEGAVSAVAVPQRYDGIEGPARQGAAA